MLEELLVSTTIVALRITANEDSAHNSKGDGIRPTREVAQKH
jgi:hypothetical protein